MLCIFVSIEKWQSVVSCSIKLFKPVKPINPIKPIKPIKKSNLASFAFTSSANFKGCSTTIFTTCHVTAVTRCHQPKDVWRLRQGDPCQSCGIRVIWCIWNICSTSSRMCMADRVKVWPMVMLIGLTECSAVVGACIALAKPTPEQYPQDGWPALLQL